MMRYRLLKSLPWTKAGYVFTDISNDNYEINIRAEVTDEERFEPIKEREIEYPEDLMKWYIVHFSHPYEAAGFDREEVEEEYQMWNRFPTEEKASAYILLKNDVARFPKIIRSEKHHLFSVNSGRREIRRNLWNTIDYVCQDFSLHIDATSEEMENRAMLLKNYYWF